VRTGGYEAEFGQVFGGNVNVITRSGGNELRGDVFGYYDSESLASSNARVDDAVAANKTVTTPPRRLDAGVDLGGYFLKDRLWFFGAYDRVLTDQDYDRVESFTFRYPAPGAPTPNYKSGTDRTRTNLFSGKLRFLAGPSQTIALSVFGDPGRYVGRRISTSSPQAVTDPGPDSALLTNRDAGGTDISAKWDGVFGTGFTAELQYGYHEERNRNTSGYPDVFSIWQIRAANKASYRQYAPGSSPPVLDDETYRRNVLKASGTAFFGSHEFKAGLFYEKLNSTRSTRLGGGEFITQWLGNSGAFYFARHIYYVATPLNCTMRLDGSTGNFGLVDKSECKAWQKTDFASTTMRANNLAAFVQDSWKIGGNLTINAGLRYEEQRLEDSAGNTAMKLTGEWSPRVGAVWDPLRNGKSKVFASYGRYYQMIPQDIQTRALGNGINVAAYNYTPDKSDTVASMYDYPTPFFYAGDYVPGLKGTYQDELVAGVEYQFAKDWSVGVKGIYRSLGRVLEDRCDLGDSRVGIGDLVPPGTIATCVMVNIGEGEIGQVKDPNNPQCFSDYPKNTVPAPCESVRASRYFRGLQLDLTRRFADRFYLIASYLYSKLEGNYDGLVNQYRVQTAPGENIDFDYLDVVPNAYGRLALDRRHQFKVSGSYAFTFGLQAGINSYVFSGAPLSIIGTASVPNGGLYPGVYLVPRGSNGELPWTYNVDLHLEYPVRLGAVSVIPIVDVFNVTNVQQVTGVDQDYNKNYPGGNQRPPYTSPTNPTYGMATAWQKPRLIRVGARVTF
jgi:hypothetical protein